MPVESPVSAMMVCLMRLAVGAAVSACPGRTAKASSMEYSWTSGEKRMRIFITRFDMSPYRAKFEEKTATWWRLRKSRTWKTGAPILMPRAFASFDLAMMHPSLFDRTTRGRLSRSGLKTFSQEAKKLSQSTSANIFLNLNASLQPAGLSE